MFEEGVVWESRNGTWSKGFFAVTGEPDNPQYDFARFMWVSVGHTSKEEAFGVGPDPDPQNCFVVPYKGHSLQVQQYNQMSLEFRDPVAALAYRHYSGSKIARLGHQAILCGAATTDGTPCQNLVATKGRKCQWHRY